jgi:AcrR family transcriptional regulator
MKSRHAQTTAAGAARRGRRTRADRSATTRARILDAVVASIDDVGFARTTAQRIARGAGVSVGAVQHHFPAKADILAAVLERSFRNLSAKFKGVSVEGASLAERVGIFVDRAWLHYGSAAFRSTLEILSNARGLASDGGGEAGAQPILASARRATRLWNSIFSNVDLPARRQREIRQFAFASLSGLAIAQRLQPARNGMRPQVEMLKTSLHTVFERALSEPAGESRSQKQTRTRGRV